MGIGHFRLGKNAGLLLMKIAQERFMYDLDPKRALEVLTRSLIDIPIDLAVEILYGSKVIEVSNDKVSVNIVNRDNKLHSDYPKIDVNTFIVNKQQWIEDKGKEIINIQLLVLREINRNGGKYDLNIDLSDLLYSFFETKEIPISEILNDNPNIDRLIFSCKLAKEYLERVEKIWSVFRFIDHHSMSNFKFDYNCSIVTKVSDRLSLIIEKKYNEIEALINEYDDTPLKRTIDAELKISKSLNKDEYIQPVDIKNGYSAGWLSPDGLFFGLNGEIANMLHEKLADAIRNRMKILNGIDPIKKEDINMDGFLSRTGWVKIHGDHILFDGYEQSYYGMPLVPITDKQIESIAIYGQVCHHGMLRFGLKMKPCSSARFEMTDKLMISKLFNWEDEKE